MRKIVIDGKEFMWNVGRSFVSIRNKAKSIHFSISFSDAFPNEDIERAKWKKYFHITPSDVESIIRKYGLV